MELLIEAFNLVLLGVISVLALRVALLIDKMDPNLLKAKFFLKSELLRNNWLYITAAGTLYLIREGIGVYKTVTGAPTYGLFGLTETFVFIIIFALVWQWHNIICTCVKSSNR